MLAEDRAPVIYDPEDNVLIIRQGSFGVPRQIIEGGIGETPSHGTFPGWGTHVSPDEAAKTDGALGILGRIILGQTPPDPRDPANWS